MLIESLTTRVDVAVDRHGLEDPLTDGQQGHVGGDQDVPGAYANLTLPPKSRVLDYGVVGAAIEKET